MTSNSAGKGRRKPWTEKQKAFLVGHIERKKRKAGRKADRESVERLDAWLLQTRFPEKAKAKRLKGTKNNKEASRQRSQMFVERFEAWPSVLSAEEIGLKIRAYLREQATWKWKGCAKHYPKKEASVRKKLTKLGVYRFNFPLGLWFKCGSPEEALEEAKRLEAEQDALRLEQEARRLEREEREYQETIARGIKWKAEQEAKRKAEEAKRQEVVAEMQRQEDERMAEKQRQNAYLSRPIDWASLTADEVALGLWYAKRRGWLVQGQGLDDLGTVARSSINYGGVAMWLGFASNVYKAKLAEAVLVAD